MKRRNDSLTVFLFLLLCFLCSFAAVQKPDYSRFKVLSTTPRTGQQLNYLKTLCSTTDKLSAKVDFWRDPTVLDKSVLISTNDFVTLEREIKARGMSVNLVVDNLQSFLDIQMHKVINPEEKSAFTEAYHTYAEINAYLNQLASNNTLVTVSQIGQTYESRGIFSARISSGGIPNKPAIYIECGMHAREWISHATCIWIIDSLTSLYGQDAEITRLVDRYDWHITPVSNPDGYEYTWTTDRLWRKNRKPTNTSVCIGVDSNRNFDANFGGIGSSTDECSETFSGPFAFSEAESQAMRDVLLGLKDRLKAVVSIHSNAQLWISPFGYTLDLPADYDEMKRIMTVGVAAINATNGFEYVFGPGSEVLYFTSGTTKDYVYDTLKVIHGYTLELRNTNDGFTPPASLIAPVATESWNGLKAMANAIV